MNIANFLSHINRKGVVKASHFNVEISRTYQPVNSVEYDISMRCLSTELPGVNIDTIEHSYAGPQHKIASGASYIDQNLSILLSEDFIERKYFEDWKSKMVGDHSTGGGTNKKMFNLAFFEEYVGTVTINTYNELGEINYKIKLHEAFPTMIGSMQLNWSSSNEFLVLPVTFTYRYYTQERI